MNKNMIITNIKEEENRNVISVTLPPNQSCKTCGIYTRRDGSAYCEECAKLFNNNN